MKSFHNNYMHITCHEDDAISYNLKQCNEDEV